MKYESLGQYHGCWAHILLSAPDNFTTFNGTSLVKVPNQGAALTEAFEELKAGFHFAERKVKDERLIAIMREMIQMSLEAYRAGKTKHGAHTLQEVEGMIWKGSELPVKYAVEAERRAFGEVVRFAGVRVSPYPMEKTADDLGEDQRVLLAAAEAECQKRFKAKEEFKFLAWAKDSGGAVSPVSEPSRRKLQKALEERAQAGTLRGAVIAELVFGATGGLIVFHLHQRGMPRVEAIARTKDWGYEPLRFHFHDPTIFPE